MLQVARAARRIGIDIHIHTHTHKHTDAYIHTHTYTCYRLRALFAGWDRQRVGAMPVDVLIR